MSYKLLIFDLDDTLIGDDLVISDENKAAIYAAQEKGVICGIATGRMFDSAMIFAKEIGLTTPVISCQGAMITDSVTREKLYEQPVPIDLARQVLQFAEDNNLYAQYYDKGNYYMKEHCSESKLYEGLARIPGIPTGKRLLDSMTDEPTKLLLISDPESIRKYYEKAIGNWGSDLEIAISKRFYLEFTHPEAKKGNAVRKYAKNYGIDMEDVICIGDGLNDLSMIEAAGLGVAMENGAEELKNIADYITVTQKKNAIADVVNKYIL